ncbi:hypothetical protein K788_0000784 [Paraburkholderia caribensis MBA4]|uniref:Uncharacterized protein n=1 Tax=Paraburkholderia caribensis MBA4 TaxID=1323664 RepID=A0A0P0RHD4_9BURK|nr:hypothetical protein K788_0000784 [Paraburkholderia caribensis MBA4]
MSEKEAYTTLRPCEYAPNLMVMQTTPRRLRPLTSGALICRILPIPQRTSARPS